jgi:hypothetical protein
MVDRTVMSCRLAYVFFFFFFFFSCSLCFVLFVLLYSETTECSIGSLHQGKMVEKKKKQRCFFLIKSNVFYLHLLLTCMKIILSEIKILLMISPQTEQSGKKNQQVSISVLHKLIVSILLFKKKV